MHHIARTTGASPKNISNLININPRANNRPNPAQGFLGRRQGDIGSPKCTLGANLMQLRGRRAATVITAQALITRACFNAQLATRLRWHPEVCRLVELYYELQGSSQYHLRYHGRRGTSPHKPSSTPIPQRFHIPSTRQLLRPNPHGQKVTGDSNDPYLYERLRRPPHLSYGSRQLIRSNTSPNSIPRQTMHCRCRNGRRWAYLSLYQSSARVKAITAQTHGEVCSIAS